MPIFIDVAPKTRRINSARFSKPEVPSHDTSILTERSEIFENPAAAAALGLRARVWQEVDQALKSSSKTAAEYREKMADPASADDFFDDCLISKESRVLKPALLILSTLAQEYQDRPIPYRSLEELVNTASENISTRLEELEAAELVELNREKKTFRLHLKLISPADFHQHLTSIAIELGGVRRQDRGLKRMIEQTQRNKEYEKILDLAKKSLDDLTEMEKILLAMILNSRMSLVTLMVNLNHVRREVAIQTTELFEKLNRELQQVFGYPSHNQERLANEIKELNSLMQKIGGKIFILAAYGFKDQMDKMIRQDIPEEIMLAEIGTAIMEDSFRETTYLGLVHIPHEELAQIASIGAATILSDTPSEATCLDSGIALISYLLTKAISSPLQNKASLRERGIQRISQALPQDVNLRAILIAYLFGKAMADFCIRTSMSTAEVKALKQIYGQGVGEELLGQLISDFPLGVGDEMPAMAGSLASVQSLKADPVETAAGYLVCQLLDVKTKNYYYKSLLLPLIARAVKINAAGQLEVDETWLESLPEKVAATFSGKSDTPFERLKSVKVDPQKKKEISVTPDGKPLEIIPQGELIDEISVGVISFWEKELGITIDQSQGVDKALDFITIAVFCQAGILDLDQLEVDLLNQFSHRSTRRRCHFEGLDETSNMIITNYFVLAGTLVEDSTENLSLSPQTKLESQTRRRAVLNNKAQVLSSGEGISFKAWGQKKGKTVILEEKKVSADKIGPDFRGEALFKIDSARRAGTAISINDEYQITDLETAGELVAHIEGGQITIYQAHISENTCLMSLPLHNLSPIPTEKGIKILATLPAELESIRSLVQAIPPDRGIAQVVVSDGSEISLQAGVLIIPAAEVRDPDLVSKVTLAISSPEKAAQFLWERYQEQEDPSDEKRLSLLVTENPDLSFYLDRIRLLKAAQKACSLKENQKNRVVTAVKHALNNPTEVGSLYRLRDETLEAIPWKEARKATGAGWQVLQGSKVLRIYHVDGKKSFSLLLNEEGRVVEDKNLTHVKVVTELEEAHGVDLSFLKTELKVNEREKVASLLKALKDYDEEVKQLVMDRFLRETGLDDAEVIIPILESCEIMLKSGDNLVEFLNAVAIVGVKLHQTELASGNTSPFDNWLEGISQRCTPVFKKSQGRILELKDIQIRFFPKISSLNDLSRLLDYFRPQESQSIALVEKAPPSLATPKTEAATLNLDQAMALFNVSFPNAAGHQTNGIDRALKEALASVADEYNLNLLAQVLEIIKDRKGNLSNTRKMIPRSKKAADFEFNLSAKIQIKRKHYRLNIITRKNRIEGGHGGQPCLRIHLYDDKEKLFSLRIDKPFRHGLAEIDLEISGQHALHHYKNLPPSLRNHLTWSNFLTSFTSQVILPLLN